MTAPQQQKTEPEIAAEHEASLALSHDAVWSGYAETTLPPTVPPLGVHSEQTRSVAGTDVTAAFTVTPDPATVGAVVTVDAGGSTGPVQEYTWDFGDTGPEISGVTMTHSYVAAGDYTITLTVTGAAGTDTASQQLTVT